MLSCCTKVGIQKLLTLPGLLMALAVFVCNNTVDAWDAFRFAQDTSTELRLGDPISSEMPRGGVASFKISASSPNSYFQIVVEQQGSVLSAELFDPQGNSLIKIESVSGAYGPLYLSEVAKAAGAYRLEIRSIEAWALPGRYEVRLQELRTSEAADEERIAAERTFTAGQYLASRAGKQSDNEAKQSRLFAIEKFKDAAQRWHALKDPHGEVISLYMIGVTYQRGLSQSSEAKQFMLEALKQVPLLGLTDWRLEASIWNDLGVVQYSLYDDENARIALENALKIYDTHQDRRGRASVHNNLGLLYLRSGQIPEAIKALLVALPIRQAEHDKANELTTLNNMGGAYERKGEPREALDYYEKALQGWREIDEKSQIPTGTNNVARASDTLGSWQTALTGYQEALALAQKQGQRRNEATFLYNLGDLYNRLNDPLRALENYQAAVLIQRELKNPRDEANVLAHMAQIYLATGQSDRALENYNNAMKILEANTAIDSRRVQAYTLIGIASAYLQKDPNRALEYCERARKLSQEAGDLKQEADALEKLGEIYSALNKKPEALANLNSALVHRRTLQDRFGIASTLFQMASLKRDLGQLTEAAKLSEELLGVVESLRGSLVSQQSRTNYFARTQSFFELHIDVMMQLYKLNQVDDQRAEALVANERRRARGLVDSLVEAGADIRQGISKSLLSQLETNEEKLRSKDLLRQQLINEIAVIQKTMGSKPTAVQITRDRELKQRQADLSRDIGELISESDEIQTRIKLNSRKFANLKNPTALTLKEIQQSLLDDGTTLLEYSLGEKRSYAWIITSNSINSVELAPREEIEALANRLLHAITERNRNDDPNETPANRKARWDRVDKEYEDTAAALSKLILAPLASHLQRERLVVVADGALQQVPFGLLRDPTTPNSGHLIAKHEIVSLPSASVLALQRQELANRKPAPPGVALVADPVFELNDQRVAEALNKRHKRETRIASAPQPPRTNQNETLISALRSVGADATLHRLMMSRTEAAEIARVVPNNQLFKALDFQANRSLIMGGALSKYRYVHLATHGVIDLEHPELSGIVLSMVDENGKEQDGYVRLYEIYNLNLPAELVVLSACQTGVGKQIKGEGLIALTRGFMYAGAARIVASLWKVDDSATAALMAQFYKEMFTNGKRPAAALRAAQTYMSEQKRWNSPYYWAGFVLQGEWR